MSEWMNEHQDTQLMRISQSQAKPGNQNALIYHFCTLSSESKHSKIRL